jgi:hypothetical protein
MSAALGDLLFADVETYARQPFHHTGTMHDQITIEWLADDLKADGAAVQVHPWSFPRWAATWSAELDGNEIDSLPIFYETTGTFCASSIDVVATAHPGGLLTVKNRHGAEDVPQRNRATLQVAGRYSERINDVRAQINDAQIVDGQSANIFGGYECGLGDVEVLIATPLSGWFSCASERGSGIAVARWLARELAERGCRVGLLATSGHELFNIGLERHLSTHPTTAKLIVHVGASVGARHFSVDQLGPGALSDLLFVTTNQDVHSASHLVSAGFQGRSATSDPKGWIGEGTRWCSLNRPLLSVAGISHWFHTPDDRAQTSTTPALLMLVATALLADVNALLSVL